MRVFQALGIETSSSLRRGRHDPLRIGDIMLIEDHINMFPEHPLHARTSTSWAALPRHERSIQQELRLKSMESPVRRTSSCNMVSTWVLRPTFETRPSTTGSAIVATPWACPPCRGDRGQPCQDEGVAFSIITDWCDRQIVEVSHEDVQEQPRLPSRRCWIMRTLIQTI